MKVITKIFTAAIAITIAALPVTQASARDIAQAPRHEAPRHAPMRPKPPAQQHRPQAQKPQFRPHVQPPHFQKRKWTKGHRFQNRNRYSEVRDYRRYGLQRPGHGQRWMKVDNDYLLVSIASGIIAGIIAGR